MDPLVSIDWLAAHLLDPDVVVLDATLPPVAVVPVADTRARYEAEHIPGALFFDIEALSDKTTALPHMLPRPEDFAAAMGALGVSDAMTIAVYEQVGVFSAPRAWWRLRAMGATNVRVLDGDLAAWKRAGQATEAGNVVRPPAAFRAVLDDRLVRNVAQVQGLLARGGQVIDARSAARFAGTAPEPRAGVPSGHMPGAVNLPFTAVLREGRLQSRTELLNTFGSVLSNTFRNGVLELDQPIVTTCGSGVTAAVLALALERCGAAEVSLYDGSWAEYSQHPGAVIVGDGDAAP